MESDQTEKKRILQRGILGPGLTIAIHGKKGERVKGVVQSEFNRGKHMIVGDLLGAGAGAGLGALLGRKGTRAGAAWLGASAGGALGTITGGFTGTYGKHAREIYRNRTMSALLDDLIEFKIKIKKENEGKFTATKEKTGKTTAELKDSKNPLTRKRAVFAENAKKWGKNRRRKSRAGALSSALDDIIEFKAIDLGYSYGSAGICSPCDTPEKKHYPTLYINDREDEIDLPLSGEAKVKFKLRSKTARQDEQGKKRHSADIEIQSIDLLKDSTKKPKEGEKAKQIGFAIPENLSRALRKFKKKKTDQGGMVPGAVGTTSELSEKEGEVIELGRGDQLSKIMGINMRPGPKRGTPESKSTTYSLLELRKTLKRRGAKTFPDVMRSFSNDLDRLIEFGDPRPRNPLGEFANQNENVPDPNTMATTYRRGETKGIAEGAGAAVLGGASAGFGGQAVKSLMAKLRKARR